MRRSMKQLVRPGAFCTPLGIIDMRIVPASSAFILMQLPVQPNSKQIHADIAFSCCSIGRASMIVE